LGCSTAFALASSAVFFSVAVLMTPSSVVS
jgi:hypothetical protein